MEPQQTTTKKPPRHATVKTLGPPNSGKCRLCGKEIPKGGRRKSWCSAECSDNFLIAMSAGVARSRVEARDKGICASCGTDCRALAELHGEVYRGCGAVLLPRLAAHGYGPPHPMRHADDVIAALAVPTDEDSRMLREFDHHVTGVWNCRTPEAKAACRQRALDKWKLAVAELWRHIRNLIEWDHPLLARALDRHDPPALWECDHIVPVAEGGGSCGLDNLRTMCRDCHTRETKALRQRLKAAAATGGKV